jgi:hypothetical protein
MSTDATDAEYAFVLDDAHLRTLLARERSLGPKVSRVAVALFVFIGACLALKAVLDARQGDWTYAVFFAIAAASFGWALFGVPRSKLAGLRRSPDVGREIRVRVGSTGIVMHAPSGVFEVRWPAFVGWKAFDDGVLVLMRQRGAVWLPDAARIAGDRALVVRHLNASIAAERVPPAGSSAS